MTGSPGAVWSLTIHPEKFLLLALHATGFVDFWSAIDQGADVKEVHPLRTVNLNIAKVDSGEYEPPF